jgi:hypothetical protein
MSGVNFPTHLPQPTAAFVGEDGSISRPWLYFLMGLFNRSDAVAVDLTGIRKQIAGLFVENAFEDSPQPAPRIGFSFDTLMSDEAMQMPLSLPVLLSMAFSDDVPRPSDLNPFLVAILVSDPS